MVKDAKEDLKALGKTKRELDDKQVLLAQAKEKLQKISDRWDILNMETQLGGRLSVYSGGTTPLTPEKDYRYRLEWLLQSPRRCVRSWAVLCSSRPVGRNSIASRQRPRGNYSDLCHHCRRHPGGNPAGGLM